MNIWRVIKIAVVLLLLGLVVGFFIWTNQVAPADETYVSKVSENPNLQVTNTPRSLILSLKDYQSQTGIVFIPGAKVDPHAYLFKLSGVVENTGVTVVITKPTYNLALFDLRPIATFTGDVNGIDKWYIAGHSLGGVRACQYAADQSTHVTGLILFGSYCDTDVSVPTLNLTAENDKLTSPKDVSDHLAHLKGEVTSYQVDDASHASFGDYGKQSGDGDATIDSEFMRLELTDQLTYWLSQR